MTYTLHLGDSREVLKGMAEASVDAVVCDPPYELGFMGKGWDSTGVANDPELWAAALRVLKPGGYLLAFSGTRTYHRMACAIEDAGFEVRDQIFYVYGSGFPKSHNLDKLRGKAICGCEEIPQHNMRSLHATDLSAEKHACTQRIEDLQPSLPELAARQFPSAHKGSDSQASEGHGRFSEPCLEGRRDDVQKEGELQGHSLPSSTGLDEADGTQGRIHHGAPNGDGGVVRDAADQDGGGAPRQPRPYGESSPEPGAVAGQPEPQAGGAWPVCGGCGKPVLPKGLGTALKPAHEPIVLARKPLIGSVAVNVLAYGTGALNIDGCRVATNGEPVPVFDTTGGRKFEQTHTQPERRTQQVGLSDVGRWPANIIHDGSDEVVAAFPDSEGSGPARTLNRSGGLREGGWGMNASDADAVQLPDAGTGSAARFFASFPSEDSCPSQPSNAPTAAPSSSLQNVLAASVQSVAAIWPSLAGILSSDSTARSTTATDSESRTIFEIATAAMATLGSGCSREQRHEKRTPCGSLASVAATRAQTGTTTITASLSKSDGSVARATFTITPTNVDLGEAASRFRYCAKASREDRHEGAKNVHPTVKPTDLMRYLCRLVTPKGGTVLDPFMGSGSTGKAAILEGFAFVGIDLTPEYVEIARARIEFAKRQGYQPDLLEAA